MAVVANPFKSVLVFYFELPAIGRGEVVRLFLEDCGIPFEDERVPMEAWKTNLKQTVVTDGRNPASHVPIVTIDGKVYTEHISICRYIARRLGLYGKDIEKDFFADAVADAYQEWRNAWAASLSSEPAEKEKYVTVTAQTFAKVFETFLSYYKDGPFFTGADFTFADAAVFQIIHDDNKTNNWKLNEQDFPLLTAFYAAVQARPRISSYITSSRRHE